MKDTYQQSILSVTTRDKSALYGAYMSFLQNGGLFVPTTRPYRLGDGVFLLLPLMDDPEKLPAAGRVVWVTPKGAQGNRQTDIVEEFSDEDVTIIAKIKNYLAGSLISGRPPTRSGLPKVANKKAGP